MRNRLVVVSLVLGVFAGGALLNPASGQIPVGHWDVALSCAGTTTSQTNGSGSTVAWPGTWPVPAPTQPVAPGSSVLVAMSGSVTATLRWVDQNGVPLTDPPPPEKVYVLERAVARWECAFPTGGAAELNAHDASDGLGDPEVVVGLRGSSEGRRLRALDGSSGTVTIVVPMSASLSVTGTEGSGTATATLTYSATVVAPADCYDFSGYPCPPPSGSTPCAQDAATKLAGPLSDGTGYFTDGRAYTNQTAQHALEQLQKTAIFYVFGHGGSAFQSCQTFWNNGEWGYVVETEYARQQIVNSGVPEERVVALATLPAGALNKVLLAVFEGCYTGYCNAGWGSPVHGVVAKGADCALGFTGPISDSGAHTWATRFWDSLKTGDTVYSAWSKAAKGLFAFGVTAKKFEGNQDLTVHAARYGN